MPNPLLTRRTVLLASAAVAMAGCAGNDRRVGGDPKAIRYDRPGIAPGVGFWYTAVAGEDLLAIADRAHVPVGDIVATNNLRALTVAPGQRLWIPGVTGFAGATPATNSPGRSGPSEAPIQEVSGDGYVLVPRAAWTDEPVSRNNNPMGTVLRITLHHTGEHLGLRGLADVEVIRRIEHYHRSPPPNGRGWAAIGYHFLVGKDGKVYEGRPARYQGAHVSGANENNLGISVIGDFSHAKPSARQLAALSAFLADKRAQYKVAKNRVHGHRDLGRSECPGDALYGWLKGQGYSKQA
jgi:hypothetical protein